MCSVGEWPPACVHISYSQEDIKQLKKTLNENVSNLINICPADPIQVLNPRGIFEDFVFVLQMTHSKYSRDKANMGNPQINRGCPLLTANRTSADCVWITSGPSMHHIPLWVYHTGGFNAIFRSGVLQT